MSKSPCDLQLMAHESVVDAFEYLTPIAMSDAGQAKRLANFLLVRRNGPGNADFEIVNIAFEPSRLCEAKFLFLPPLSQRRVNDVGIRACLNGSKYLAELRGLIRVVGRSMRSSDLDAALAHSLLDIELVRLLERGDPS